MDCQVDHQKWMKIALEEAQKAAELGEVPVGALVVKNDKILSQTHNLKEATLSPTGHAEIHALEEAAQKLQSWRLADCTLYVTLEPCLMCTGALIQSRIGQVVFGARDPKAGTLVSNLQIFETDYGNHKPEITEGVLEQECSQILKDFFKKLR